MVMSKKRLKERILLELKEQGFKVNPHLRPKRNAKDTYKKIHQKKRLEKLKQHKNTLLRDINLVKKYSIDPESFDPKKIELEIREVKPNSEESKIFFWWNLMWWSLPYDKSIGRQMKFIIWDKYHDAPFGLIGLQSPPLRNAVRDKYLNLNKKNIDFWINQSLYGQRIGALPPYNSLLGGKMVTLALTCNEIRTRYKQKYDEKKTLLSNRKIPSELLFITTTSAFGRSPIYERIKYPDKEKMNDVTFFIGFTSGAGTFHLSEDTYQELLKFVESKGINVKRGYGTGPSRKLKLISKAFELLGIPSFSYHNIKRGFYFIPHVSNIHDIISRGKKPRFFNRPFNKLSEYWKNRWCIPRSERTEEWKKQDIDKFFNQSLKLLSSI